MGKKSDVGIATEGDFSRNFELRLEALQMSRYKLAKIMHETNGGSFDAHESRIRRILNEGTIITLSYAIQLSHALGMEIIVRCQK